MNLVSDAICYINNLITSNPFITNLLAVALGGIITWFASRRYYRKAAKDLIIETTEIRKGLKLIALLEADDQGVYRPKLDENGNLVGLYGSMRGSAKVSTKVSGSLSNKNESQKNQPDNSI